MSELHQVQKAVTETYDRLFSNKSTDPSVMSTKLSKYLITSQNYYL